MSLRKASAQRHELLERLLLLTNPSTSPSEQLSLVEQLYNVNLAALEECLLQVAHVCITHNQPETQEALRSFMLWLAGRSLHVALRLSWTVDAVSDFYRMTGLGDRVKHILDGVETWAINQDQSWSRPDSSLRLSVSRSGGNGSLQPSEVAEEDMPHPLDIDPALVFRKETRLKIFNDERVLVTTLTDLSTMLRYYPDRSRRKDELRKRLRELNTKLGGLRVMHPLGSSSDPVRWIVNIAVEECTVFSSRERAPYLIRYEVIVDDTATMQDPTLSRLRRPDGRFRVSSTSEDVFEPHMMPDTSPITFTPTSPVSGTGKVGSSTMSRSSTVAAVAASSASAADDNTNYLQLAFGESNEERTARVRRSSPWGSHPDWSMSSMIVKAGDDLRQEELALQLIHTFDSIWKEAGLTCCAHPYIALPTNGDCGLLEVVDDSNSMDGIKKSCHISSIQQFFAKAFDGEHSQLHRAAVRNFAETMAGYSVITYILQIKDRHNGNLMISRKGELVHIDFGFLFSTSPGGLNFESAPFKLSQELIDVMGGQASDAFAYYKLLVYQALDAARERADDILGLISLMTPFNTMPCFGADPALVVAQVRNRFRHGVFSEADYALYTKDLISNSADNWRTRRYDQFQTLQNGIL